MQASTAHKQQYQQLCQKVDERFNQLHKKFSAEMHCRRGCHQCCLPNLTISELERQQIQSFIQEHQLHDKLEKLQQDDPHEGSRCAFLDAQGDCSIFPVRPIICRSHGAPALVNQQELQYCELNFTGESAGSIKQGDWINIETLNLMLLTLTQVATKVDVRSKLNIAEVMR